MAGAAGAAKLAIARKGRGKKAQVSAPAFLAYPLSITVKPLFFRRLSLALGALGCALALASCTPLRDDNAATPNKEIINGNDVIPNAANAVEPANAVESANAIEPANSVESTNMIEPTNDDDAATNSAVEFASLETIYVPGQDDLLHEQKVSRKAIDSQLKSGDRAAPGLQEIIEKAPAYYPAKAKINSTTETAKAMTLELKSAFANDEFWRGKGEKVTELAVYAIVNSAAKTTGAGGVSEPKPVMFTIDKKPAALMGEFDVEGEIKPQMRLIAPK